MTSVEDILDQHAGRASLHSRALAARADAWKLYAEQCRMMRECVTSRHAFVDRIYDAATEPEAEFLSPQFTAAATELYKGFRKNVYSSTGLHRNAYVVDMLTQPLCAIGVTFIGSASFINPSVRPAAGVLAVGIATALSVYHYWVPKVEERFYPHEIRQRFFENAGEEVFASGFKGMLVNILDHLLNSDPAKNHLASYLEQQAKENAQFGDALLGAIVHPGSVYPQRTVNEVIAEIEQDPSFCTPHELYQRAVEDTVKKCVVPTFAQLMNRRLSVAMHGALMHPRAA